MNASASSLDREVEVQSEIRKVRRFSRYARVVCAAIFGFGLVGAIFMLLVVALGLFFPRIHSADDGLAMTPELKMWMILVMGVMTGVMLAGVYQLYRLFGNLAAGAIYTPENVRRVRRVGLLWLLLAALGIVIPFASAVLVRFGFIDSSVPIQARTRVLVAVGDIELLRFGRAHPARFVDHGRRPVREGSRGRAAARRRSRDLNGASACLSS